MTEYKNIEGHSDLIKDMHSKAVINTNRSAYLAAVQRKKSLKNSEEVFLRKNPLHCSSISLCRIVVVRKSGLLGSFRMSGDLNRCLIKKSERSRAKNLIPPVVIT